MMCACLKAITRTNVPDGEGAVLSVIFGCTSRKCIYPIEVVTSHEECHSNLHFQRGLWVFCKIQESLTACSSFVNVVVGF